MKRLFSFPGLSDKENDKTPLSVDQKLREVQKNAGVLSFRNTKTPANVKMLTGNESIGFGSFGTVTKRYYEDTPMAVKSLTRTVDNEAMFRTLMDLEVVNKSIDCPEIVKCYGYFITDVEVLICMEYMDTCLDKLLRRLKSGIPEDIIGKINVNVLKALRYLKDKHKIIHRDIKPSNILLDRHGNAKLCDFGISRELVESLALSNQGCKPYMPPERLSDMNRPYGIQSDVWSLGITLVELATGTHPYVDANSDSNPGAMMFRVMYDDPPRLHSTDGFSQNFCHFVAQCLQYQPETRPKYDVLLQHPFVTEHQLEGAASVEEWVNSVI